MLVIILTSPSSFTDDPLLDIPPEMLSLRFPSVQGTTTRQETKSEVSPPNREKQTFKVSQVQVINFVVKINFQKKKLLLELLILLLIMNNLEILKLLMRNLIKNYLIPHLERIFLNVNIQHQVNIPHHIL